MTTMVQAFTQDERFIEAVDATIADSTRVSVSIRPIVEQCVTYLDLRYRQRQSLRCIARQLHCSQKTLHRYVERHAHHALYSRLLVFAPDMAAFFQQWCADGLLA